MHAQTGARDEQYDLVSVLYHALQGAESATRYVQDAKHGGDDRLASFFEEVQSSYCKIADRAEEKLANRLGRVQA